MNLYLIIFFIISLKYVECGNVTLQIAKYIDNFVTPVNTNVEEKVGTTFSLVCELVSSSNDNKFVDENLSWFRGEKVMDNSKLNHNGSNKTSVISVTEINKSEKKFEPLKASDNGNYYCVSFKFNLFKNVDVIVMDNMKNLDQRLLRETNFCTDQMFECVSNGVCIIQHYVCDGKPDCKDGSDESVEHCTENPCKEKIPCDDGRCIPTAWCCDRNHDLSCMVTNRPKCCQALSESYEELEYGIPNINHSSNNGARYLFISVCIISIVFSIVLLLLILSKVVIYAKKSALQQRSSNIRDDIALRNQTNLTHPSFRSCTIYNDRTNCSRTPRSNFARNIIIDTSDVSDPLIFPPRFNVQNDQPPSYIDVLRNSQASNEPPPPYTSREVLNDR